MVAVVVVVITQASKSFNRTEKEKKSFEAWNKIWLNFPHWVTELRLLCGTGNKVKYEFHRQLLATSRRNPFERFHVSELIKLSRKYFLHRYLRIMPRVSSWKSQTIAHERWGERKMMKNLFALKLICNFIFLIFSTCTNFPWKRHNRKYWAERQFH